MVSRMKDVMTQLAIRAKEVPFQRAVDRLLPEIEDVLEYGYTFGRLAAELKAAGYEPASGAALSGDYLAGSVSRARAKVRQRRDTGVVVKKAEAKLPEPPPVAAPKIETPVQATTARRATDSEPRLVSRSGKGLESLVGKSPFRNPKS